MAIEVSQKKQICEGGKNGGRKRIGFAILRRRANGGAQTLRNGSKKELFREMLTST